MNQVWIMQGDGTMTPAPEDHPVCMAEKAEGGINDVLASIGYKWIDAMSVYGQAEPFSTGLHEYALMNDPFPRLFAIESEDFLLGIIVCNDLPSYLAAQRLLYPSTMLQRLSLIFDVLESRSWKIGERTGGKRHLVDILADIMEEQRYR